MRIGQYVLENNLVLAPMAGVTDRPFRQLCRKLGAGMAVSEMVTSDISLWNSRKTQRRLDHTGEDAPRIVQIAGGDPDMMAQAAAMNVVQGAQIIDINMGCPAKKVCNKAAGSALLQDEGLVKAILEAVIDSVDVPVTLKIRTGWNHDNRNGIRVAEIAQAAGVQALAVHGRTRADLFKGEAEYETIRAIVRAVDIPVMANGDIDSPEKARDVLEFTGAAAVMIGRAAQGRPWIFREIGHFLATGERMPAPGRDEVRHILLDHLQNLYRFYGEFAGVRIARKHIGWYCQANARTQAARTAAFRKQVMRVDTTEEQTSLVDRFFSAPQEAREDQAA